MDEMTWTAAPPSTATIPISAPFMGSSSHLHSLSLPFGNSTAFPGLKFLLSPSMESSDSSSAYSTPTTATALEVWPYSSMSVNYNSDSSASMGGENQQNQIAKMTELRSLEYDDTEEYSCDTPTMDAFPDDALPQPPRSNTDQPHDLLQVRPREVPVSSRSNRDMASSSSPARSIHSRYSRPSATSPTTTAAVTSIQTTSIMSPSLPQQHLNAQQYLTLMNEAASRIRALADGQQQSSVSPLLLPSNSLYNTTSQAADFASQPPSSNSVVQNCHPAYQHLSHLALRRAQSVDVFAPQISSLSLNTGTVANNSSSENPMMILLPRHHSPLHSAGTPQSAHPQHNPYNDYFGPSNASSSSSSPSPASASAIAGGASADSNMNLGMGMNMHMMENHHVHIPLTLSGSSSSTPSYSLKRNRPDLIMSSSPFPTSLSSSFFSSSSSSTSPSPSSPSPLMLPSSSSSSSSSASSFSPGPSSSLAMTSSGRHKRLSIMTNTSYTFASAPGAMSSSATNSSASYPNLSPPTFFEHYRPAPESQGASKHSDSSNKGACTSGKSSGRKPRERYVCQIPDCHRTFSRPFNLKSHGLTHETRRPHACVQCPKTFARIHDRDRHSKGHLLEKAHSCIVCLGRFARQDAVTRHLKLAEERNPCALILKSRGVSFREAAAGRVRRSALGEEGVIRRALEGLEEQARKARASKNLEMGMMTMNMDLNTSVSVGMEIVTGSGQGAMEAMMDAAARYEPSGMMGHGYH